MNQNALMKSILIPLALFAFLPAFSQNLLGSTSQLEPLNVVIEASKYKGKDAIKVVEKPDVRGETLAILKDFDFTDGTIELELAGAVRAGADTTARGFIGLAFRMKLRGDTVQYESFYLRPTNGRSSDQLRRNHATQYISHPEFPWFKLRKEFPGVYESYVDLVPGEWTKIRIVVNGRLAKLYVHDSPQPCLVVSDLKHTPSSGQLALWIGLGTEGYFRNLRITKN